MLSAILDFPVQRIPLQTEKGSPMGSPISVVLAEITMQFFEEIAFATPPC